MTSDKTTLRCDGDWHVWSDALKDGARCDCGKAVWLAERGIVIIPKTFAETMVEFCRILREVCLILMEPFAIVARWLLDRLERRCDGQR